MIRKKKRAINETKRIEEKLLKRNSLTRGPSDFDSDSEDEDDKLKH
jgi:hypothetical protein